MTPERPTVGAVVQFAEKLRDEADRIMAADPHANPYSVTTAHARNLCSHKSAEAERELLAGDPAAGVDQVQVARADGPRRALNELQWRAGRWQREYREGRVEDRHRAERHQRRQRDARAVRDMELGHLSVGQRIDRALAGLAAVSAAPASKPFDAVRVSGDTEQAVPMFPGDPGAPAMAACRKAMHLAEQDLETARRRTIDERAA